MKKFIVSVGLVAAGTASLQAAYAPGLDSMQTTKIWSASATLRGFYDDNYSTGSHAKGSAGFEASPTVSLTVPLQQTELGLRYTYGLYYYQARENEGQDPIDQSHSLDLWVDHAFTERWQGKALDTLAIGQEPELLTPGGAASSVPFRVNGNNLVNTAVLSLNTDWTRQFSTVGTYQNTFVDYQNNGTTPGSLATQGASLSGLLDRIDQTIGMEFQWHFQPETTGLIGYKYEQVNYIGNEVIATNSAAGGYYKSTSRDNLSHYVYLGVQHNLLANLALSAKAGVQYIDYYKDSTTAPMWAPYVDLSATYTYSPGSYAQLGFHQTQNATDVVAPSSSGKITQSQESSVVFVTVNQQLTPKLLGSVIANFQNSTYNSGDFANESDQDYNLGLNLTYAFTQHFSSQLGYNYDDLQSDIHGRSYSRNRVYLGVTATY
jgi:hypothetical protein